MGQSRLDRLCDRLGIKCDSEYGAVELPEGWDPHAHPYKVVLRYKRRRLTAPFFMGSAHTREPSAADVLSCLVSDTYAGEQSFEDFCSDMGYDLDSRKAESTWKACRSTAPRLRRFLGDDFDQVADACSDH